MRMSHTLKISQSNEKRMATCSKCGHFISPADDSWKMQAVLEEKVISEMGGPFSSADQVILRCFACPSCGVLLDTEIAMKNDPFLEDRIFE
jgi:acetone carboxylase gamma subunit